MTRGAAEGRYLFLFLGYFDNHLTVLIILTVE